MLAMDAESHVQDMAKRFAADGEVVEVAPLRRGHIHSSFVVTFEVREGKKRVLLQRMNDSVFSDPEAVIANARLVTTHLRDSFRRRGVGDLDRRVVRPVDSDGGGESARDPEGGWWRAFVYIEGAAPAGNVDLQHVERAAQAFGQFQLLMTEYDGPRLAVTLARFHDTPGRLAALEKAAREDPVGRLAGAKRELGAVLDRRELGDALSGGGLPLRLVHNDAKLDNVLFDTTTGEALCVVDLDTVMPGVVGHDFGDMVRSMATRTAEDGSDGERPEIDEALFEAITRGYLAVMGPQLDPAEVRSLVPSGPALTLEQAARFLSDHLLGDVYYPAEYPGHNLDRSRNQLALLDSLIDHTGVFEGILTRSNSEFLIPNS